MTEPYRIPKPNWRVEYAEETGIVSLKPHIDKMRQTVWEVEETVLTTAVVDLLRSKGWTVEPPEGR